MVAREVLRELVTVLGFQTNDGEVATVTDMFFRLKAQAQALTTAWEASVAAVQDVIDSTVELGSEVSSLSAVMGVTTDEVQELQLAAEKAGIPFQSLSDVFRQLSQRAAESVTGSAEMGEGFRRLGVSVTDANGNIKPTMQLFLEIADAASQMGNESERNAALTRVAGEQAAKIQSIFLEGSKGINEMRRQFHLLGGGISAEYIPVANELASLQADIDFAFRSFTTRLGVELFPVIKRIRQEYRDWIIDSQALIDQAIKALGFAIELAIETVQSFLNALIKVGAWLNEHRPFVVAMAYLIGTVLVQSLFAGTGAMGGFALAAAKAMIPFLGWGAVLVGIGLILDDVYNYITGNESALGNLIAAFRHEAIKPDSHWMVRTIEAVLSGIESAILAIDDLFKIFFDQSLAAGSLVEGFGRTLQMAAEGIGQYIEDMLANIVGRWIARVGRLIARLANPLSIVTDRLAGNSDEMVQQNLGELRSLMSQGAESVARSAPRLPAPADPMGVVAGASASPVINQTLNVTMNGSGVSGADATRMAREVQDRTRAENDRAMRNLASRRVR